MGMVTESFLITVLVVFVVLALSAPLVTAHVLYKYRNNQAPVAMPAMPKPPEKPKPADVPIRP